MTVLSALIQVSRVAVVSLAALAGLGSPALAQPAFWAVRDSDSTIYILGTVHLLRPETQWRSAKLDAALAEAAELWLELPTTSAEALQGEMMTLVSRFGLSPARPLSQDLTEEEMGTLDEAARLAGLTGRQLNVFRPWFAALTISTAAITKAGYDAASGVDASIEAIFAARGIRPKGLETPEEQIRVFANMSREQELDFLRQTMQEYRDAATELDLMVSWWASANIVEMEKLFVTDMKQEEPDLYAALLANRNANWVAKIEDMLKGSGVVFIAVGAGHLLGPDSVIAMLAARGVTAERLQ